MVPRALTFALCLALLPQVILPSASENPSTDSNTPSSFNISSINPSPTIINNKSSTFISPSTSTKPQHLHKVQEDIKRIFQKKKLLKKEAVTSEGGERMEERRRGEEVEVGREKRQALTPFEFIREGISSLLAPEGRQFNSMTFPSLEAALLSLAFLTFAVFLVDLVQDLMKSTNNGRSSRDATSPDMDMERMTDLIVFALSAIDLVRHGRDNPECGMKFICHLNRSGWHGDDFLGNGANYVASAFLALYTGSDMDRNMEAAQYGKEDQECFDKYTHCPSIFGDLIFNR